MAFYFVNKNAQPTGEHEVHKEGCVFMPDIENRIFLGYFTDAKAACMKAKEYFSKVDGCFYCAEEAHKG